MSFRENPNLAGELAAQIRARGTLRPIAEKAADRAEALAHHAMPRPGRRRIVATFIDGDLVVLNTNYGGHLEEWGLAHTPTYAPLRRGVRAAGLNLRES